MGLASPKITLVAASSAGLAKLKGLKAYKWATESGV